MPNTNLIAESIYAITSNGISNGYSNTFQNKVSLYAIFLLFILMFLLGGPFFATENWRLIWLGALMATALHFFPYYFVHGKSMIFLGLICVINISVGYIFTDIPLEVIAYIDSAIKFATVHYELCLTSVLMALKKIVNIFQIQT
nr:DUF6609 family protein [Streptococcus gordonii]